MAATGHGLVHAIGAALGACRQQLVSERRRSQHGQAGPPLRSYDGRSVRGAWNYLGHYRGYDHFDVLG